MDPKADHSTNSSLQVNFAYSQHSVSAAFQRNSGSSTSGNAAMFTGVRNIQHLKESEMDSASRTTSSQPCIGSSFLKQNAAQANGSRTTTNEDFSFIRPSTPPLPLPSPIPSQAAQPLQAKNPSVKQESEANQTTALISDITLLNSVSGLGLDPMDEKDRYIYAVVEGRASSCREIGFSFIDLASNKIVLSQFADDLLYSRLYTKFCVYYPSRVIVPKTSEINESFLEFLEILQIPGKQSKINLIVKSVSIITYSH